MRRLTLAPITGIDRLGREHQRQRVDDPTLAVCLRLPPKPVNQLPRPYIKPPGEAQDRRQARLTRSALEPTDCRRVNVCRAREVVL